MRPQLAALAALAVLLAAAPPASAVVGGRADGGDDHPWFAALAGCGGTLIAPDRVATAAHCVAGFRPAEMGAVRFGDGTTRGVARIAVHPSFVRDALAGRQNRDAPRDDVALVTLDAPTTIAPLALGGVSPGDRTLLLGRGATRAPGRTVGAAALPGLRRAGLRVVADRACAGYYRRNGGRAYRRAFVPGRMVCAGDLDGRGTYSSACVGDSGGPLAIRRGGAWRLAGIVSWGKRCGADRDPTVFARVTRYGEFLADPDPVYAPVPSEQPAGIGGEARVGATLTCTAPPFESPPDRVTFRWTSTRFQTRVRSVDTGERPTYTVRREDARRTVSCAAVGATAGGTVGSRPSAALRVAG